MLSMDVSPRLYEAVILCLAGIVSYFLVAAKRSMDDGLSKLNGSVQDVSSSLKELQISLISDYVKKDDMQMEIDRLVEEFDKDIQLCQAKNHKRAA
jgi:hypothetical protein